ncbi:MAG: hypothetical protein FWE25_07370 [Lachnospiraceae bacterium]|nr:hypothetical protein [Lachnospiraceae bacterium]
MTERDKKLLMFLFLFVIVVAFVWWILLPSIDRISAVKADMDAAKMVKADIERKADRLPNIEETLHENQKELTALTEAFFPLMQAQEIDNLLTSKALSYGLSIRQLNIGTITSPAELVSYVGSQQAQEEADAAAKQEAGEMDVAGMEDQNPDEGTMGETLAGAGATETEDAATQVLDMLYQSEISLIVSGDVAAMQSLLDVLFVSNGMHVTSWQRSARVNEAETQYMTQIQLTILMYEK